ncbi:hypothetical protein TSAR_002132 [Trichomalopsis sarcophagae]|uniref:Uncharacterized protein n=1 Tax=Trichomalopsis sarcophagae TaxID=543379 RepID=A0A232F390_9HYME|nr:hypothetical protein TSAR_002132 [Trichomalopsis sarcophagae]
MPSSNSVFYSPMSLIKINKNHEHFLSTPWLHNTEGRLSHPGAARKAIISIYSIFSITVKDEKQFGLQVMHLPFNFNNSLLMKDAKPRAIFTDYSKKAPIQSELHLSIKDVP